MGKIIEGLFPMTLDSNHFIPPIEEIGDWVKQGILQRVINQPHLIQETEFDGSIVFHDLDTNTSLRQDGTEGWTFPLFYFDALRQYFSYVRKDT